MLHQIGHVLGLIHEHQTPNALEVLEWKEVYPYFEKGHDWSKSIVDQNIRWSSVSSSKYLTKPYDFLSVMGYKFPNEILKTPIHYPEINKLSKADIAFISELYPREKNSGSVTVENLSKVSLATPKKNSIENNGDNIITLKGNCEPDFGKIKLTGLKQAKTEETTTGPIIVECSSGGKFSYEFNHAKGGVYAVLGSQLFGNKSAIWYKTYKFGASKKGKTITLETSLIQ